MIDQRVVRVTTTSNTGLPSAYKYARKCLRVVLCLPTQKGWASERGVEILWESDHYSPNATGPKSKYRALRAEAEAIAENARKAVARGLDPMTPAGVVADHVIDHPEIA